ncbi:MAG: ANTAR domain-containing protein [Acidimicrobiales bacterium]
MDATLDHRQGALPHDDDPIDIALAALSRILVGDRPIVATLLHVAETAKEAMGADHAAITTLKEGTPSTTAATDPLVEAIDQAQYLADSGPCLDAFRQQVINRIDHTGSEQRWPEFSRAAAEAGVLSTLALPLVVAGEGVGALNLYSERPEAFADVDHERGERLAEPAAIVLTNARLLWEARHLADGLEQALASRAKIEQAKGVLMATHCIDPDTAFDLLRDRSQRQNRKLRDVAADIVRSAASARADGTGVEQNPSAAG